MKFDDADAVIRIRLEVENRREEFLDRVFQEAGWGEGKASLAWCVGVHIGDAITKLLSDPEDLQECFDAISDSVAGRIGQFRVPDGGNQRWREVDPRTGLWKSPPQ